MVKEYGIPDVNCYNNLRKCETGDPDWKGNDSTITPQELFEKVTLSIDETVNYIYVRFIYAHPNFGMSTKIYAEELIKGSIIEKEGHRKYGNCFTYYPEDSFREHGIYYLKLSV